MTKTYDDVLSKADLENLDSFLKSWNDTILLLSMVGAPALKDKMGDIEKRRKECDDLRSKLAVAIHLAGVS